MKRKDIANMSPTLVRGDPSPCFCPDFSEDNKLYEQIDSLNEISVMESKSHLKQICQVRLQEVPVNNPLSQLNDEILMDNIIPSSVSTNELIGIAHNLESQILEGNNKSD